jgi:hypothetical protein
MLTILIEFGLIATNRKNLITINESEFFLVYGLFSCINLTKFIIVKTTLK